MTGLSKCGSEFDGPVRGIIDPDARKHLDTSPLRPEPPRRRAMGTTYPSTAPYTFPDSNWNRTDHLYDEVSSPLLAASDAVAFTFI